MLLHINKFVDKVKAAEGRALREVTMSLAEARDLHADITRLLVIVQDLHEQRQQNTETATDLEVDGGRF
jgi:hypothetical protein